MLVKFSVKELEPMEEDSKEDPYWSSSHGSF